MLNYDGRTPQSEERSTPGTMPGQFCAPLTRHDKLGG